MACPPRQEEDRFKIIDEKLGYNVIHYSRKEPSGDLRSGVLNRSPGGFSTEKPDAGRRGNYYVSLSVVAVLDSSGARNKLEALLLMNDVIAFDQ